MDILNLYPDSLRYIFQILDLDSLVMLHSTFNRYIMKSLCSSRALHQLDLRPVAVASPALKYLLRGLRDVHEVLLPPEAQWTLSSLLLLQTLNPQSLTIHSGLLHSSTLIMIGDHTKSSPEDATLAKFMALMKPLGFPNLEVLTPRLHTLTLESDPQDCISARGASNADLTAWKALPFDFVLPSTLTSISLANCQLKIETATKMASATLYHLRVEQVSARAFTELINFFPYLESFKFNAFTRSTFIDRVIRPMKLPASLHTISCYEADYPQFLFQATNQPLPSDLSAELKLPNYTFVILRPYSVTSLELITRDTSGPAEKPTLFWSSQLSPFPITTLTELAIEFRFPCERFFEELSRAAKLLKLTVASRVTERGKPLVLIVPPLDHVSASPYVAQLKLIDLPKNLHTLCLDMADTNPRVPTFLPEELEFLPPTLQRLQVSKFALAEVPRFRERLPDCHIHITQDIDWRHSPNGKWLRQELDEKIIDFSAHMQAIDKTYTAKNVRFNVVSSVATSYHNRLNPIPVIANAETLIFRPFTTIGGTVEWKNSEQLLLELLLYTDHLTVLDLDGMVRGPNLRQFKFYCLTVANFGSCDMTGNWPVLPPSLTQLTATSRSTFEPRPPSGPIHFRVLDTPNWSIPASFLFRCAFRDSILKCRVTSLLDTDVRKFLTKHVSRETRSKMSVSLVISVSGKLSAPELVEEDDGYPSWERKAMASLTQLLNEPMVYHLPTPPEMDTSQGEEKVGSVVSGITCYSTPKPDR